MTTEIKPEGILLINKESGIDSNCIVDIVKRRLKRAKTGHAGTLDPLASGLLILCVGRKFTRLVPILQQEKKEYVATIQLGRSSTTFDRAGRITSQLFNSVAPDIQMLRERCEKAIPLGEQLQSVPSYSALKIKGEKMLELARRGKCAEKQNSIEVFERELISWNPSVMQLTLRLKVSKGTYIRSLAQKLGKELGCGALLYALTRTSCGSFSLHDAHHLESVVKKLEEDYSQALQSLFITTLPGEAKTATEV